MSGYYDTERQVLLSQVICHVQMFLRTLYETHRELWNTYGDSGQL